MNHIVFDWGPPKADHDEQGVRYEGRFGGYLAVLEKRGRRFFLFFRGESYDLGKRATFDTAERLILSAL